MVEYAAKCTGLYKRYTDVVAVNGLDLEVHRGECFGLLGPNGAGKTTTVEILEGLTPADEGKVEVLGHTWGNGDDQKLRDRLGIQLQETILGDKLKVREVVAMFRSFHSRGRDPDALIALLGLEAKRDAYYTRLSGGQKQRVALACALVGEPDLLFLDEPTTGLDPQARRHIWQVVEDYKAGGGTVLLTTHYMEEAATLCDRVGIIDEGRVVRVGTPQALIADLGAHQVVEIHTHQPLDEKRLEALLGVNKVTVRGDGYVLALSDLGVALPLLLEEVKAAHTTIASLTTHEATLEDVFLALTGKGLRDD